MAGTTPEREQLLTPEWAHVQRFEDDEWLERSLTRLIRRAAGTVRVMEHDARTGQGTLF